MDNRIHKVSLGEKLLSFWCAAVIIAVIAMLLISLVGQVIGFSRFNKSTAIIVLLLTEFGLFAFFLVGALGTWLVTTSGGRIETLALLNVNRLLARSFSVLLCLLIALMIVFEVIYDVLHIQDFAAESDQIRKALAETMPVLFVPWMGCLAVHYAWLYYDLGIVPYRKARWYGIWAILGGVALLSILLEGTRAWSQSIGSRNTSLPFLVLKLVQLIVLLSSGMTACANIIRLPRLMKAITSRRDSTVAKE